jgi:hypothetical protein
MLNDWQDEDYEFRGWQSICVASNQSLAGRQVRRNRLQESFKNFLIQEAIPFREQGEARSSRMTGMSAVPNEAFKS